MKPYFFQLATCLLGLFYVTTVNAQINWEQVKSPSGLLDRNLLGEDLSGRMFLMHRNEMLVSVDHGDSWTDASQGLPVTLSTYGDSRFFVFPNGKTVIYSNGYYAYNPANNTWTPDNTIDGILFLDVLSRVWKYSANNKVFLSQDGGTNFNSVPVNFPKAGWNISLMANFNDEHNLAFTMPNSSNGKLYHFKADGTVTDSLNVICNFIGFNPYSGTAFRSEGKKQFRSTDGGHVWTEFVFPAPAVTSFKIFALYYASADLIWASCNYGVFFSEDGGINWQVFSGLNKVTSVPYFFRSPNSSSFVDLPCTDREFSRSDDNGANWTDLTNGFDDAAVDHLSINQNGGMFIKRCGQILYSNDIGATWNNLNITDSISGPVSTFAVHPAGDLFTVSSKLNVFRSTDHGYSWFKTTQPVFDKNYNYVEIHVDEHNGAIYLFTWKEQSFKSTDKGQTWTPINFTLKGNFEQPLQFLPNEDILYGGSWVGYRYSATMDTTLFYNFGTNDDYDYVPDVAVSFGGTTLAAVTYNHHSRLSKSSNGGSIAHIPFFNSRNPRFVEITDIGKAYVISNDSVYLSTDDGFNWIFAGKIPFPNPIMFQVAQDQHLYLGYTNHTVYRNAVPVSSSEPNSENTLTVLVSPNPVSDAFNLVLENAGPANERTLHIFDLWGRNMYHTESEQSGFTVSSQSWHPGIYFYTLKNSLGQVIASGKLIKG
jgi:photosystem II stability/assembly factor-like uncharacterized protein